MDASSMTNALTELGDSRVKCSAAPLADMLTFALFAELQQSRGACARHSRALYHFRGAKRICASMMRAVLVPYPLRACLGEPSLSVSFVCWRLDA